MTDKGRQIESKDVLVLCDDIRSYSGFATNGRLVCYALSQKYDVANASPGASHPTRMKVKDEEIDIYPCPTTEKTRNSRGQLANNVGKGSMGDLIGRCDPDYVVSLVDVQMCNYLGDLKMPKEIEVSVREAGQDIDVERLIEQFSEDISEYDFQPNFEWVAQVPIDGEPLPDSTGEFFREVDHCVAMSRFGKEQITDTFPDIDVSTIPHGLDYREVDIGETEQFLVGTVNRNQFRKQYPRLIKSLGKFYEKAGRPDDVNFYLHCNYDDPIGWDIERFLEKHGIAEAAIKPRGSVTREELMVMYNQFDVFASATAGEGFGLTTIEAMSQETPVVITDYTTSEELLMDGEPSPRGKLVDPVTMYDETPRFTSLERALVDCDQMADEIYDYYQNQEKMKKHGEQANEWVHEQLSWENVSQQWIDYFEEEVESE